MEKHVTLSTPAFNGTEEQKALFLKILSLDLEREKQYLANRQGFLDDGYLDEMEIEYKKFMFLLSTYNDLCIPISEEIDDLWHTHVLHTKNYSEFCLNICGKFIHHNPTMSDEENLQLMPFYQNNTLVLYAKHFGYPVAKFWLDITPVGACCTH